ncbi:MAG: phosphate ABC transporter ATP-binding protein [Bacteroidales bacterium]
MDKESLNFTNAFHRFQDTKEIVQNKDHQQEDLNGSIIKKDATIDVENLNVYIQNNHILKNISLKLYDKKITCIIGPSGCGKTTLLKSFNRMIDTTEHIRVEGSVIVDGENIYDNNAEITHIRKKIGLLSQRPTPLPMSIYDNVAFGCRIHGIKGKKTLDTIVKKYLQGTGLWDEVKDRLNNPASRLSIGQQQRLCLARGLAVEPQFILADEATSALDPISSKLVEDLFIKLRERYGIIMVTHTLRQALRIADYVIFMYLGEVIEQGTAKEFFNNPQHELTKQYLSGVFS